MFVIAGVGYASHVAYAAPVQPGSLLKLACPARADVNHPCRAVYYAGGDGKRHAFPNARVFMSWYSDFSGVETVSSVALASLPLGRNVTYRPGVRLVKFTTDPKVYAVGLGGTLRWVTDTSVAEVLYGGQWNTVVDDISDAFVENYRFGDSITSAAEFSPSEERAVATAIDADLPATHRVRSVTTASGTFPVDVVTLHRDRYAMRTSIAGTQPCETSCVATDLRTHAARYEAAIGIHGSYFCPPDYADCAGKEYSFNSPFFDSTTALMANEWSIRVHEGPIVAFTDDGVLRFFRTAVDFGRNVAAFEAAHRVRLRAAASNYPALMVNGIVIVAEEPRLDTGMRMLRAVRGGMGWNDRFFFVVIARRATVLDLADIMESLGATSAMNLDGGGSAALLFNGAYVVGPGRLLPNAILFVER